MKKWRQFWRYIDYALVWLISGLSILLISVYVERYQQQKKDSVGTASEQLLVKQGSECWDIRVIDGDTIHATCENERLSIRLKGIDAPEMGQVPYGEEAKQALAAQLSDTVYIEFHGLDYYKRTLGVLYRNNQNINLAMVRMGFAVAYKHKSTEMQYVKAEQLAKRDKLGVWSKPGLQQDPKSWRRYH